MANKNLQHIISKIKKFRDDRHWMQFHDPKNMAISIIIEASELLEHFQWKTKKEVDEHIKNNKSRIEAEIADIGLYLFELSDNLQIDLLSAMEKKIKENEKKYPVKKAKGNARKYNEL
jgi:NTP pyrophosphatase (non-canonical NTP hydrolase)